MIVFRVHHEWRRKDLNLEIYKRCDVGRETPVCRCSSRSTLAVFALAQAHIEFTRPDRAQDITDYFMHMGRKATGRRKLKLPSALTNFPYTLSFDPRTGFT